MPAILETIACLCALSVALQASNDDCSHPPIQEVVPEKPYAYIRSVVAPSVYDCAAECQLLPLCLSFTFDSEKRTCQRLSEERAKTDISFTVNSGVFFSNIHDWKMSLIGACGDATCGPNSRCTLGRNGQPLCEIYDDLGMNCTHDDECHTPMTSCFRGLCLCHPGYSHNVTSNACERDCKTYGNTMTLYKSLAIKGHNRRAGDVEGEFEEALKMCMKACTEEKSFQCKTVDFRPPTKCHLSSEGYLDVSPSEREEGLTDWWMAVIRCP